LVHGVKSTPTIALPRLVLMVEHAKMILLVTSVLANLDLLAQDVRLMSMNVRPTHVQELVQKSVLTLSITITAPVNKVSLEDTVRLTSMSACPTLVLTVVVVETVLANLPVCVLRASQGRIAIDGCTPVATHHVKMVVLVLTTRAATTVPVSLVYMVCTVNGTRMNACQIHVKMAVRVLMVLTVTPVNVPLVTLVRDVKLVSMSAVVIPVKMVESVGILSVDISVTVQRSWSVKTVKCWQKKLVRTKTVPRALMVEDAW